MWPQQQQQQQRLQWQHSRRQAPKRQNATKRCCRNICGRHRPISSISQWRTGASQRCCSRCTSDCAVGRHVCMCTYWAGGSNKTAKLGQPVLQSHIKCDVAAMWQKQQWRLRSPARQQWTCNMRPIKQRCHMAYYVCGWCCCCTRILIFALKGYENIFSAANL